MAPNKRKSLPESLPAENVTSRRSRRQRLSASTTAADEMQQDVGEGSHAAEASGAPANEGREGMGESGHAPITSGPTDNGPEALSGGSHIRIINRAWKDLRKLNATERRRVRYIWLNVEFASYVDGFTKETQLQNERALATDCIVGLVQFLSHGGFSEPLTLELSMQSVSDGRFPFRSWHFGGPREVSDSFLMSPAVLTAHEWPDVPSPAEGFGWFMNSSAVNRVFLQIPHLYMPLIQPMSCLTKFVIRRQCRRHIRSDLLQKLTDKMPNLRELVYEPWRVFGGMQWEGTVREYSNGLSLLCFSWKLMTGGRLSSAHEHFLTPALLKQLRRVSIFEDYNEHVLRIQSLLASSDRNPEVRSEHWCTRTRMDPSILEDRFARHGFELEHLAVSYMIDAYHFFQSWGGSAPWSRLVTLYLTSDYLSPLEEFRGKRMRLLQDAAVATLSMPMLERLTIWYARHDHACSFTFLGRGEPKIIWKAHWDLGMTEGLLAFWRASTGGDVAFEWERMSAEPCEHHGRGMALLNLPPGVVDEVSFRQILREADFDIDSRLEQLRHAKTTKYFNAQCWKNIDSCIPQHEFDDMA